MILEGNVWKYGRNVDTDLIIPARYLNISDPRELARHAMEDLDSSFIRDVKPGDIIVAEENFGSGSSREHAPLAIKEAGISIVIAKTFARIFYRNAINIGLPILECPDAVEDIDNQDRVRVDLSLGKITNLKTGAEFQAEPFPHFMQNLIEQGGLEEHVKTKLSKE